MPKHRLHSTCVRLEASMKTNQIAVLFISAIALSGLAGAAGYLVRGNTVASDTATNAAPAAPVQPRAPLYYQDPDGKPDYSPTPKKTADGRDFKPVYSDEGANQAAAADTSKPQGKGRILYYRNPMGLPDTSKVPKKDSMGMNYIPVYQGEEESGVVTVSPARLQTLGLRTAPVTSQSGLDRAIRATGSVQPVESGLAIVSTKFDVVVQKLFVSRTGEAVRAGQPLAQVWIDTPDTMMQRGPDVISRQINYVIALQDKNPAQIAQMENILRQYGIPDAAIAEIRRTGQATREITITAPRSGVVLEKQAIEGMREARPGAAARADRRRGAGEIRSLGAGAAECVEECRLTGIRVAREHDPLNDRGDRRLRRRRHSRRRHTAAPSLTTTASVEVTVTESATALEMPMRVERTWMMQGSPTRHNRKVAPPMRPSERSTAHERESQTSLRTAVLPGSS